MLHAASDELGVVYGATAVSVDLGENLVDLDHSWLLLLFVDGGANLVES